MAVDYSNNWIEYSTVSAAYMGTANNAPYTAAQQPYIYYQTSVGATYVWETRSNKVRERPEWDSDSNEY